MAGFVAGWAILLDYIINPLICVIWCSGAAVNFFPGIPLSAWKVIFAIVFTVLNLRAIEASSRTNTLDGDRDERCGGLDAGIDG